MQAKRIATAFGMAVFLVSAVPVFADDAADLNAKLNAAMSKTTSFQVQMTLPVGAGVIVADRANKMVKASMSFGAGTIDTVTAGSVVYMRLNGGDWQARTLSKEQAEAAAKSAGDLSSMSFTALPDKTENGATVGVVQAKGKLPAIGANVAAAPDITLTCTYDKTTFLMRTCSAPVPQNPAMGDIVMTYGKWNDPANVVTVPAGVTPVPAVSAAPAPAASPAAK